MTAVPSGWQELPLGEVADTALGKMLDKSRDTGRERVPYLRNLNVQWGRIDTEDIGTVELDEAEVYRFSLHPGDLLVCEGGEVGRAALWSGSGYMAYQKALHRIRPRPGLDSRYLRHLLEHLHLTGYLASVATGSTIKHLPQEKLRALPVPLPPIEKQRRIVDLLEDHLSRLDAAEAGLDAAEARLRVLREQYIRTELFPSPRDGDRPAPLPTSADAIDDVVPILTASWRWARLEELAEVVGGITKDSSKQSDPEFVQVPYLRVANVQRGRLDLRVVTMIRTAAAKAKALTLEPGDVLLNEGGDRDKLGRGWVWEGQIDNCIHQNHVFRARIRDDALRPRLLSWAANSVGGQWCERNGKQSVNLASISLSKIRRMPIPVPPLADQADIEDRILSCLDSCARLQQSIERVRHESRSLRRSLLAAAFSGRLTGDAASIDRIEESADV